MPPPFLASGKPKYYTKLGSNLLVHHATCDFLYRAHHLIHSDVTPFLNNEININHPNYVVEDLVQC